jgi:DNA damage-inducible protein 1
MQLLVTFESNENFLTLDVGPDMTLPDLMGLIEIEGQIAAEKQIIYYNNKRLTSEPTRGLKEYGFSDGDMILVRNKDALSEILNQERQLLTSSSTGASGSLASNSTEIDTNGDHFDETHLYPGIEQVRTHMLQNPTIKAGVLQRYPQLESKINDAQAFRNEMVNIERERYIQEEKRKAALKKLQDDPYDPESQQIILNNIRADAITENFNIALEENPEVFASVTMLFVNIRVNGHHVKAFVDSGAQATIMSPECAEACSLGHLIDKRFQGLAMGVGTAKILGRIHTAPLLVGNELLAASFTVMEGKNVDFLLGLDLLKKYQAQIDLKRNLLCIANTEVPFLPESEIPKNFMQAHAVPPVIEEVGGAAAVTEAGVSASATGAARAPPEATTATALKKPRTKAAAATATTQAAAKSHPEQVVQNLVQLGFPRQLVLRALDQAQGNPEVAAALLFDS